MLWIAAIVAGTATPADPSVKPAAVTQAAPSKLVCRSQTVTGSLALRTRVCKTPDEWRDEASNAQRAAERAVDMGHINSIAPQ